MCEPFYINELLHDLWKYVLVVFYWKYYLLSLILQFFGSILYILVLQYYIQYFRCYILMMFNKNQPVRNSPLRHLSLSCIGCGALFQSTFHRLPLFPPYWESARIRSPNIVWNDDVQYYKTIVGIQLERGYFLLYQIWLVAFCRGVWMGHRLGWGQAFRFFRLVIKEL